MKNLYLKRLSFIALLLAGSLVGVGQTQLLNESFETDGQGTRYSASTPFNDGSSDHWNRTDGSDISNTSGSYSNFNGNFFWAAEDTDDNGGNGNDEQLLDITGISISGFNSLNFAGLFGAGNENGAGASAYDAADYIKVTYRIDGGGYQNLIWFSYQNNGDAFNEPIGLDTDFDGEQDGALLTSALQEFTAAITGTGNTLDIKIAVYMDSGNEEIAFDSLVITGVASTNTIISQQNGNWNTVATWTGNAVPSNGDNVVIDHVVNLDVDATVSDLTINSGDTLKVNAGQSITITGTFTNNGHLLLLADNTGYSQMKLDGSYAGTGVVAQQQYTSVEGWHPIGSPFTSAVIDSLGDQAGTNSNLVYWDASNYDYVDAGASLNLGAGYLAYFGTNGVSSDATGPWNYKLQGTPNTSVSPTLEYTTSGTWGSFNANNPTEGWNLIANPFSCNLDFTTLSLTNVDNSIYIYNDGTDQWTEISGASPAMNVAPMQGFWVRANAASPSIGSLTPSANGTVSNGASFLKQPYNRIVLEVDANGQTDELMFALIPNTTDGFDANWDAWKMENGSGVPNLYSHEGNEDMAINAVPTPGGQQSVHDVGIRCDQTGTFSIGMDASYWDSNSPYQVWLYDNKTDFEHNLLNGDYTFTHDPSYTELRFELRLRDPLFSEEEIEAEPYTIRYLNNQWAIDGVTSSSKFVIRNINGSIVQRGILDKTNTIISNQDLSTGLYIIELNTENGFTLLKAIK